MVLEKAGDLDGAIEAARRLIEIEPDEALSHTGLSRLYQQKGMIPEAEAEMAIATKLSMTKKA
jgi:Flp pilus assembly protein TadD